MDAFYWLLILVTFLGALAVGELLHRALRRLFRRDWRMPTDYRTPSERRWYAQTERSTGGRTRL